MDKVRTKMVWVACELPTPRWEVLRADSDWAGVSARLGLPLIVKPAREGSTLGLTKVARAQELPAAFAAARVFDALVLAEEFVAGEELTAGFVGEQALPVIQASSPAAGAYDYQTRSTSPTPTRYLVPERPEPAARGGRDTGRIVPGRPTALLGGRGWGRADLDDSAPLTTPARTCSRRTPRRA